MAYRSPLLAALLGALVLAGCGSENEALIPQNKADQLSSLVADAGQASAAGECEAARRAVRTAEQQVGALPRGTDRELRANLREWLDDLDSRIADECSAEPEVTPTPEATETATPEATETATPEPTETATPEPTATVDPGTGGEEGPVEELPGSGGVPPGDG